jgi:prolyl-tRNA editing enzyme YbaK/EbsC (Cys-tRNA(Pro) deacylase)
VRQKARSTSFSGQGRGKSIIFVALYKPCCSVKFSLHSLPERKENMIPEKVRKVLESHNLKALEFEPGSTPTAETAAARIGVETGQIAKSILFKGKDGRFFLVVCAGDKRVLSGNLKRLTGVKCSMASAEDTLDLTGYPPGGVCPFGLEGIENLLIYLDKSLEEWETVYPAAGTNATGVPVTFQQLLEATGAGIVDLCD